MAAVVTLIAVIGVPFVILNETRSRPSSSQEFTHIGEKLSRAGDVWFRLRMQVEAVRLIARAPLGLEASGISWADEGMAAAEAASNVAGGDISVHNGYLSLMMNHGWFAVIVIAIFLASLGSCIWKCVRHPGDFPGLRPEATVAIAVACFGLIFVAPSLHHANVFRREPVSLVFMALMSYCEVSRRRFGRDTGNKIAIRGRTEINSWHVAGAT